MKASDEDALICDFAQYYGLHDYLSYGVSHAAVLACGLPPESRTVKRMTKQKYNPEIVLQAMMVDRLSLLVWSKTKDAQHGHNRPEQIAPKLLGQEQQKPKNKAFRSAEEFERERKKFIGE